MNLACPSAHSGQLSKPPAIWKIKDFENIEHKDIYLLNEWLNMVYSTLMVKNVSSPAEIRTREPFPTLSLARVDLEEVVDFSAGQVFF